MSPNWLTRLVVAAVLAFLATPFAAQERTPISLPSDPSTVVILIEDRTASPWGQCQRQGPFLTVRADGGFSTIESLCGGSAFQGKLTATELQDVLHFVIEEQQFFSLNPSGSYKPPRSDNLHLVTDHARTTYVQIQTADRRHDTVADWGVVPGPVDEMQRVEKRLRRLVAEMKAGQERVTQALVIVNQFLRREHPNVAPFKSEDLVEFERGVWRALVTSTRLTFQRELTCECEELLFNCNCEQVSVETSLGQPPLVRYDAGQRKPMNPEALREIYIHMESQ